MNDPSSPEETLFEAARRLIEPQEQAAYLERVCGGDQELRQRVERLLRAGQIAQVFFQKHPAAVISGDQDAAAKGFEEGAGSVIGRYKLLQKLGEGGMGVVYMAEQEEPVRRRVALKIIKLGMDTKQVVARFEAERQALALMDHPNIARVLDGGATDTGRPYFVMELVQGVPITEFCDRNHLSTEQRLKLFTTVCQAIQSAHQKGIIHRDLKPTNILVALNPDGSGFPKIIDFGVAKAISQKLTEKTLFTAHGMMVGTPAYMSPEQAEMSHLDVDTRADIYSLGALLYELLTGSPPFPEQRLRSAGYSEMQRIILEERPVKPSTRLSTLQGEQRSIVARNRGASEVTMGRGFPGDLDWIVMKCLEKDRARRYDTANGLAHDIERHLRNEPVTARPPSRFYEFQKTMRRHWVGFSAVAAVLAALSLGVAVSTWEAVRAKRSETNETKQKATAQQFLYKSLVGEARATRLARKVGYRDRVFALLQQAKALDVPNKNLGDLRQEGAACLGDFVGLTPVTLTYFRSNITCGCLDPTGNLAAFGSTNGAIQLREVPSGRELVRFTVTNGVPLSACFSTTGDQLFAVAGPTSRWSPGLVSNRRIYTWASDADGQWRETENRAMPEATARLFNTEAGVFNVIVDLVSTGSASRGSKENSSSDTDSRYARFRLFNLASNAFVAGCEVTNALPQDWSEYLNVSRDGRVLAVATWNPHNASDPTTVNVYYFKTGQRIGQFHQTKPGPLDLSYDGKYLSSASLDVGDTIYAVPSLERVTQFKDYLRGAAVPICGDMVALARYRHVQLWDLARGREVALLDEPEPVAPDAFTPDGSSLLVVGGHHARLYRLTTPERLDLPPHAIAVPGIAFSPDGSRLASVSKDRVVRVSDALTGRTLWQTNDLFGLGQCVSFSPDGQWLAAGHWDTDRVWIGDAQTGKRLLELVTGGEGPTWSVQFSPDGRYLATAEAFTNGIKIWAIARGGDGGPSAKLVKSWQGGDSLVFAPDGRSVAFCGPYNNFSELRANAVTPYVWDFEHSAQPHPLSARIIGMSRPEYKLQCLRFTQDGGQLIGMDTNFDIVALDVTTGKWISSCHAEEPLLSREPLLCQPSPDCSKVAVSVAGPSGNGVSLLDRKSGKLLYSLGAEPGVVWWLAWSPDSRRLAVSRDNGNVAIWDLDKVEQILAQLGLNP